MQSDQADLVLAKAALYRNGRSKPGWLAIAGGRIAALGSEEDVRPFVGQRTEVIDLDGHMVVPGFQDAHVHPEHGGSARLQVNLHEIRGRQAYENVISAYAREHPERPWIVGSGWSLDDFPRGTPHRSILDAIVPDRPVYLRNRDGHGAWVNSRALEMAGISGDTPDPSHGRIERDEDGSPQGTLHESAMFMVGDLVPQPTQADIEAGLLEGQRYLHSLGITAWQDAWVEPPALAAYRSLAERGDLTARVVVALWWERERDGEQIEEILERRATGTVGRLRATSVKIMQDGICENFTAGMLEPYLDADGKPTANRGMSFVEPEELKQHVTVLDREGFQVHFHAIGDRAVREALDAVEAARMANGPTDHRHHIAHIQVVHPDDVPRFAALGATANGQPYWAGLDGQMRNLTIPFLGPERTERQYVFASLMRSGSRLAFGSDWPVSTPNPLAEMQVAVTRRPHGEDEDQPVFLPDERLDLAQAIDAFTMGSAYVNHLDEESGSLDVGKLADVAVIDRDLFAVPPESIAEAKVVLTMVEGALVFSA